MLLLTCSRGGQQRLPVRGAKVTADLPLKPAVSERRKPAHALKPAKDACLNRLLRFEPSELVLLSLSAFP